MRERLRQLRGNAEFHSSLVRVGIWVFTVTYVGLSSMSVYHDVDTYQYLLLFGTYLLIFITIIVSVIIRSEWRARQYATLLVDITATSFGIYLTKDVMSPFFILYFWMFLSYGTRFGKHHLMLASLGSTIAYLITVVNIPGWEKSTFEISFVWLSLILLPFYQFSLLRRLHRAKQRAELSQQEAEAFSQAKSTFLANMSHEIRTPLNGLMSMGQLLLSTPLSKEQREYAENLVNSGWALNEVINEILDFSKIEAGKLVIRPVDFRLRPLLDEIMQLMRFNAEAKSLKLEYRFDCEIQDAWHGDASRLRQVLINLIGNAIRFTHVGEVTLCVGLKENQGGEKRLRFSVIDTGIGIEASLQDKLFERFTQLDETPSRAHGGTGLGLAISKHLVEAMGGNIGVLSEAGRGSNFWFELPMQPAEETLSDAADTTGVGRALKDLRVLLVDDDAINRLAGQRMLEQQGCKVILANNGREALRQLKVQPVDLVLMDVHMPVLDGIEATRRIRKGDNSDIPVIGLTASVMRDELERYLEAGMDAVIAKPVEAAMLTRTITSVIAEGQAT